MSFHKLTDKNKTELPWSDGIMAAYEHSDEVTFGHVCLPMDSIVPEHNHPHEQWTFLLSGKLEFEVDGDKQVMDPGTVVYIPSNVKHSGRALEECFVVDVFRPAREDYKLFDQ